MTFKRFIPLILSLFFVIVWVFPCSLLEVSAAEVTPLDLFQFASEPVGGFLFFGEGLELRIPENVAGGPYCKTITYIDDSFNYVNSVLPSHIGTFSGCDGQISFYFGITKNVYNSSSPYKLWSLGNLYSSGYRELTVQTLGLSVFEPNFRTDFNKKITLYVNFYDSSCKSIVSFSKVLHDDVSSYSDLSDEHSFTVAIPSGSAYFDSYCSLEMDSSFGSDDIVNYDTGTFHYIFYGEELNETEPTEPGQGGNNSGEGSGSNTGSGNGTGSGSGSGSNYPAFDDSGIIGSVGSAADKVIDQIGGAIDDQTSHIGNMIDGVRDDLSDIEENLDDVNTNLQDANDKLDDANSTLSDTLDEVKSLPEKIMDGISGLFVPDESDMAEYNDRWSELLRSRFGALYESADIISSVGSAFTTSVSEPTDTIDFPAVTLDLAGAEFVFGGWEVDVIPEGFEGIVELLKTMISLLATVSFVNALRNKLDRLMEGA